MIGKRFGNLTVTAPVRNGRVLTRCSCGFFGAVSKSVLGRGDKKMCRKCERDVKRFEAAKSA